MYTNTTTEISSSIYCSTHEVSIPLDPANTDYQAVQEWVAEGNTPEEAK